MPALITASAIEVCATACRFILEPTKTNRSAPQTVSLPQTICIFDRKPARATPQFSASTLFPGGH
jgi:hypothetical protein